MNSIPRPLANSEGAFFMSKGSYGRPMGLVRLGHQQRVHTFHKRDAKLFVCNRCGNRFKPGETGKATAYGAYRHVKCPVLPEVSGWSSKHGDA
jgi:hypothetical protein